jgi:butyryl-CoA dehydrogenase
MQLPTVVEIASMSFFYKASVSLAVYPMLTRGNANTILAHGTPKQAEVFAKGGFEGRTFGTMCLSEPQAGSSLSDIATRAVPDVAGDGSGKPTVWGRVTASRATRCGSRAVSTRWARTSSTW